MNSGEYGNAEDLATRLESLRAQDRRIVPIVGSGVSSSVLPSVSDMVALMRDALTPRQQPRFDAAVAPATSPMQAYQVAAERLKHWIGDEALAQVFRQAVLRGYRKTDTDTLRAATARNLQACLAAERDDSWALPAGHVELARYYASLSGAQRSVVITTNFDPFLELAFRQCGLPAEHFSVPFDTGPTWEQLTDRTFVPIVHIHGFWRSPLLLNTVRQLDRPRPQLRSFMRQLLQDSVLLVIGYGGWADAFMTALAERVEEDDLFSSEICWAAHSEDFSVVRASSPVVSRLTGRPGFNLYVGVDAATVFRGSLEEGGSQLVDTSSPSGFTRVNTTLTRTQSRSHLTFADGAAPSWSDASLDGWPMLHSTKELLSATLAAIEEGGFRVVAALGPMGEGKSLGIRQVAMTVAEERPDLPVFWREPGAPAITADWCAAVAREWGRAVIVIDEADLVLGELAIVARNVSQVHEHVFVLASQDRLWSVGGGRALDAVIIEYGGILQDDARALAQSYLERGLVPRSEGVQGLSLEDRIFAASRTTGTTGGSLFGAVLSVRFGARLHDRVRDLIEKLAGLKIDSTHDVSLADIFLSVCLMQVTYDPDAALGRGLGRPLVSSMSGTGKFAGDARTLSLLGREAAIAFAGDRVYCRHASIARSAIQVAGDAGRLAAAAHLLGLHGAKLRVAGDLSENQYRDAFLIARRLSGADAMAAAQGALEGAPNLLGPRITMLSVMRRNQLGDPFSYGRAVAQHIMDYTDRKGAARPFFTELGNVALSRDQPQLACVLGAVTLDDRSGYNLHEREASYGLGLMHRSLHRLATQTRSDAVLRAAAATRELLSRLVGEGRAREILGPLGRDFMEDLETARTPVIASTVFGAVAKYVDSARDALSLPAELVIPFQFSDLLMLIENDRRT